MEYVEKHILQMFSYNTWIFSSLDMNKRLSCGRFPLQMINEDIFLHQKSRNLYSDTFSWAPLLTAEMKGALVLTKGAGRVA